MVQKIKNKQLLLLICIFFHSQQAYAISDTALVLANTLYFVKKHYGSTVSAYAHILITSGLIVPGIRLIVTKAHEHLSTRAFNTQQERECSQSKRHQQLNDFYRRTCALEKDISRNPSCPTASKQLQQLIHETIQSKTL